VGENGGFVPTDQTVNQAYYKEVLMRLREKRRRKRHFFTMKIRLLLLTLPFPFKSFWPKKYSCGIPPSILT
jgi:hypothetical protein